MTNMQKLQKELILNASIVSAVISAVLAAIGAEIFINNSFFGFGWFIPFMVYFLVLYAFSLIVSFGNFALGLKIRSLGVRLLTFNILGIVLILTAWFFLRDIIILASFSTFILFSLVALIMDQTKNNAHA